MRSVLVLIQLSLWITVSHAFFPWFPTYRCDKDGSCKAAKRAQLEGPAQDVVNAIRASGALKPSTFPISQRQGFESEPVARAVSRLLRKYSRYQPTHLSEDSSKLGKRQNVYRVIEPEQTDQKHSAGIWQDGSDFSYFVQAKLGSEGKELYMLVDTGAGTSWVMGSDCASPACGLHNSFGPDDSKTFNPVDEHYSVRYGSGSVKGSKVTDTIAVAGMELKFKFGVANETSDDFNHFPFDGILGMSLSGGESDNFMSIVADSKSLDKNIFCVFINRASDGPNTGELSFGECNKDKYTGDFTYTDVGSNNGDWAIPMDGLTYDGKKAGVKGKLAYVDTGTSYVFGPESDVKAFHENIPGSSSSDGTTWTVPCDSNEEVTYIFSGVSYTISAKDWLSKPKDGVCTSNIYGHEVVPNSWLLGDLFLKNVYAVFDSDEKRIGFANRTPVPGAESEDSDADETTKEASPTAKTTTSARASTSGGTNPSPRPTMSEQQGQESPSAEPAAPDAQPTTPSTVITQPEPSIPTGQSEEGQGGQQTTGTGEAEAAETNEPSSGAQLRSHSVVSAAFVMAAMAAIY
ncbi:hypothetical protein ACHAQH_001081 [Verticillium albo-atrum]